MTPQFMCIRDTVVKINKKFLGMPFSHWQDIPKEIMKMAAAKPSNKGLQLQQIKFGVKMSFTTGKRYDQHTGKQTQK